MLAALTLPFGQVADPAFRRPLLRGALLALAAFAGLLALTTRFAAGLAAGAGGEWAGWLAGALGGALALALAAWLFVPAAMALAGLFLDPVAEAVERRHYPGLPPARGAPLAAQAWWGVGFGLKLLLLQLALLPLALLLPGIGTALAFLVAAHALGAGLFEGVAQRRLAVAEARALRRRRRWPVLGVGAALAALALVPLANLLVPSLGTAAMTHLFHRGAPAGPD